MVHKIGAWVSDISVIGESCAGDNTARGLDAKLFLFRCSLNPKIKIPHSTGEYSAHGAFSTPHKAGRNVAFWSKYG